MTSFRYSEKLHIGPEVMFVDRSCAGDEADLVYLPALSLDHRADGAAETASGKRLKMTLRSSPLRLLVSRVNLQLPSMVTRVLSTVSGAAQRVGPDDRYGAFPKWDAHCRL